MKPSNIPLNKLVLLLTTFLFTPSIAAAQNAPEADEPASPQVQSTQSNDDYFANDEAVVVRGRFIPTPMRETAEVASFLSQEDLERQGDSNAAAALTRLTGLSVVGSRFVYVRGLGDRYSSALLNGSPLPSPEPLRRQVPLDLFPSNILSGVTVQKTFSPNYPGEFGGGIIDLQTLRLPTESFLSVQIGTAGNTESTDKRGLTYDGEDSDWSGIADRSRDLPPALAAAVASGQRIDQNNFTLEELEAFGESLVNSPFTVIQSNHMDPDFNAEVTAGTSVNFGDMNLGLVGVVGYDSQIRTRHADRGVLDPGGQAAIVSDNVRSAWDVVFNAFGSASLGWSANEVTLTGFLVRSTTKEAQITEGFNVNLPGASEDRSIPNFHSESTAWYERQLGSLQLAGEHQLGALDLSWRTAFAQSTRDAPYERDVRYLLNAEYPLGDVRRYEYQLDSGSNATRFSYLTDEVASGGIDGAYTLDITPSRELIISGGASYSNTVRWYDYIQFAFNGDPPPDVDPMPPSGQPDNARVDYLFSVDNIGPFFVLDERTGNDDSYKGRLTQYAAYLAGDMEITDYLRVSLGVRYEDATQTSRTVNRFGNPTVNPPPALENSYWLPSITATWNFADDLQLRAGYSQTIARPQFRELAFAPYIDSETGRVYRGNPTLTDSEFQNFDARLEYYFGQNQFVTGGVFYKDIENPIEEVLLGQSGDLVTNFINAPKAELYGVELEYRMRFDMPFDVPVLEGEDWLFAVNYTYTSSEVQADASDLIASPALYSSYANPALGNTVYSCPAAGPSLCVSASQFGLVSGPQLQGTPENIANLQFGYDTGTSQMTLLIGWVDERILLRGAGQRADVIERPGVNVDLNFRQDFTVAGQDFTLGLSARNLLDEAHEEFQSDTVSGTGESITQQFNTYDRGQTFSASLTAKF